MSNDYVTGALVLRELVKKELNICLDDYEFSINKRKNSLVYALFYKKHKYEFEYFYNTQKTEVSYYAKNDLFIE